MLYKQPAQGNRRTVSTRISSLASKYKLRFGFMAPPFYSTVQTLVPKLQHGSAQKPHFLDFKQASQKSADDITVTLSIVFCS